MNKDNNLNDETKIIKFPDGNDSLKGDSGDKQVKINYSLKKFFSFITVFVVIVFMLAMIFSDNSFNSTNKVNESVINLSTATNYDFEPYREGYILAKDGKISCYNTNQELQWEVSGARTAPEIKTNGKYSLTYYPEKKVAVTANGNKFKKIKAEGKITYGYINKNGYCVLFIEESGLKEKIVVYNNKGEKIYFRDNPDKYIIQAALSDNNRSLITTELVANKKNVSSCVKVHDIRKNKNIAKINFENNIVGGCNFIKKDKYIVVLPTKILCYNLKGVKQWQSDHGDKQISKFDTDKNGQTALLFNEDDSAISASEIIIINKRGKQIGIYKSKKRVADIDICDKKILLTLDRQLQIINTKGKHISSISVPYDFKETFYAGNKKCAFVLTNSHEARLIIPQSR